MSTKIKDTISGTAELWVETAGTRSIVVFEGSEGGVRTLNTMNQPDFIAAIEKELNVIVIDKADLPIVTDRGVHGNLFVADVPWAASLSVKALRQEAYDRLALAEYLEAHPSVDEQQVEALVTLLNETSDGHAQSAPNIARRLIATGKVTVSD